MNWRKEITFEWTPQELKKIRRERNELMKVILKILRIHFLWPKLDDDLILDPKFYILAILTHIHFIPATLAGGYHAWHYLRAGQNVTFIVDLGNITSMFCTSGIVGTFLWQADKYIRVIYTSFDYILTDPRPEGLSAYVKRFNKNLTMIYITIFMIILLAEVGSVILTYSRETKDIYELSGTKFDIRMPFPINFFPLREGAFIAILIFSMSTLLGAVGLISLLLLFLKNICFNMDYLKSTFLTDYSKYTLGRQRMVLRAQCRLYQRIVRIKDDWNEAFLITSFVIFSAVTINIAVLESQAILEKSIVPIIWCSGWIIGLSIVHLAGQELIDKNDELCNALYGMNWYEVSPTLRKDMLILMMMMQRPFDIVRGPVSNLSAASLMSVLKGTYGYMTFLLETVE